MVAQSVKHLPAMQKVWVQFLGWKFPWRRKWQPTPVFLTGESHGRRSLAGYTVHQITRVGHGLAPSFFLRFRYVSFFLFSKIQSGDLGSTNCFTGEKDKKNDTKISMYMFPINF